MNLSALTRNLDRLSRSGLTTADLENLDDDLIGHTVYDRQGEETGTVEDVLVDTVRLRATFLVVSWGGLLGLGKQQRLVPLEAIDRVAPEGVHLNRDKDLVTNAPPFQENLEGEDAELLYGQIYDAYGITPHGQTEQPSD
jgi:sporulation protein YlmC with PRC-barrel domain